MCGIPGMWEDHFISYKGTSFHRSKGKKTKQPKCTGSTVHEWKFLPLWWIKRWRRFFIDSKCSLFHLVVNYIEWWSFNTKLKRSIFEMNNHLSSFSCTCKSYAHERTSVSIFAALLIPFTGHHRSKNGIHVCWPTLGKICFGQAGFSSI